MMLMKWRDAARALNISPNEMYCGLREGRYPGMRVGGDKGRWIVDIDLVSAAIEKEMLENVKKVEEDTPKGIRRVK